LRKLSFAVIVIQNEKTPDGTRNKSSTKTVRDLINES
jgi:hypothetical protein